MHNMHLHLQNSVIVFIAVQCVIMVNSYIGEIHRKVIYCSRDVHETFQAETETRPETHRSETETRPRRWAFCPRRD